MKYREPIFDNYLNNNEHGVSVQLSKDMRQGLI